MLTIFWYLAMLWTILYYFALGFMICRLLQGILDSNNAKTKAKRLIESTRKAFRNQTAKSDGDKRHWARINKSLRDAKMY